MKRSLGAIKERAAAYAAAHDRVARVLATLSQDIARAQRKRKPSIKRELAALSARHAELKAELTAGQPLFTQRRASLISIRGVTAGYRDGEIVIERDEIQPMVDALLKGVVS